MRNTAIFLQNKFSDDDAWTCDCYASPITVSWTYFDFKQRKYRSKQDGFKFGFVVTKLK